MKTRREIVANGLPRYTGVPLKDFGEYIPAHELSPVCESLRKMHRVPVQAKTNHAQAHRGGHHDHQFRHGQRDGGDCHGTCSARFKTEGRALPRQCGGITPRDRRDFILDRGDSAAKARATIIFPPEVRRCPHSRCRKRSRPRSGILARLLDRHNLYDEPPRLGHDAKSKNTSRKSA